jgi:hypothetical protein
MECAVIHSKMIASVAYYPYSQTLCVWLRSGKCAWHHGISRSTFENLKTAESPGLYYTNFIRGHTAERPTVVRRSAKWAASVIIAAVTLLLSTTFQGERVESHTVDRAQQVASMGPN